VDEKEVMNYFTPDRFMALQDFSGDEALDAADGAWEQAVERYYAYYLSIENSLPIEYRQLQDTYYLHDAQILYLGPQGKRFVIALRLDPPPQQVLQLSYELTDAPRIVRGLFPDTICGKGEVFWLYDEIELVTEYPTACVHSILFNNGWELQLPFRALRLEEVETLLPVPQTCDAGV
jgi:hypothetical protein